MTITNRLITFKHLLFMIEHMKTHFFNKIFSPWINFFTFQGNFLTHYPRKGSIKVRDREKRKKEALRRRVFSLFERKKNFFLSFLLRFFFSLTGKNFRAEKITFWSDALDVGGGFSLLHLLLLWLLLHRRRPAERLFWDSKPLSRPKRVCKASKSKV